MSEDRRELSAAELAYGYGGREIDRLRAQIATLRAALEPFAEAADNWPVASSLVIVPRRLCRAAKKALEGES